MWHYVCVCVCTYSLKYETDLFLKRQEFIVRYVIR